MFLMEGGFIGKCFVLQKWNISAKVRLIGQRLIMDGYFYRVFLLSVGIFAVFSQKIEGQNDLRLCSS